MKHKCVFVKGTYFLKLMSTMFLVLFHKLGVAAAEVFVIYFAGAGHKFVGKGERVEVHVVLEVFEHEQAFHRRFLVLLDNRSSLRFEFDEGIFDNGSPHPALSQGSGLFRRA